MQAEGAGAQAGEVETTWRALPAAQEGRAGMAAAVDSEAPLALAETAVGEAEGWN